MKNPNLQIKQHTFLNAWTIEYQVGRNYFIMAIETEDLEGWDAEKYDSPQDFLEETDADIEKLLTWFHTEYADDVEPIQREDSLLYQTKIGKKEDYKLPVKMVGKAEKVILRTTFEKQNGLWQEVPSATYIQALEDRLSELESEMREMKEEKEKKEDIILTTKMIEINYKISAKTINQARTHNRIVGRKINGKEWGYEKKEVDKYIEKSKNYLKNPHYAS